MQHVQARLPLNALNPRTLYGAFFADWQSQKKKIRLAGSELPAGRNSTRLKPQYSRTHPYSRVRLLPLA